MDKKFAVLKNMIIFAVLSWKQSFYLEGTNTYWRLRAVACEGHRFFVPFSGLVTTLRSLPLHIFLLYSLFIIFPNPMYGSWESTVYNGNKLDAKGQTEERQKNLQGFDK